MTLPYRAVLQLPPGSDTISIAERHTQRWLEGKFKNDETVKLGFIRGTLLEQGIHQLDDGASLQVARGEEAQDGSRSVLLRFTEKTRNGTFQVDVVALYEVSGNRVDYLVVEAKASDAGPLQMVDPPRVVKALLEESSEVLDGATSVHAQPRLVDAGEVDEVHAAIMDSSRSVSVIVGVSVGASTDLRMLEAMKSLMGNLTGTATVYLLKSEAFELLNQRLPGSHSLIGAGRIRTFLPQVDVEEPSDGRRHKILSPGAFSSVIRNDGKVTEGIRDAFAAQVRTGVLEAPLPRVVARRLAVLEGELGRLHREADITRKVDSEFARRDTTTGTIPIAAAARQGWTAPPPRSSLKDRISRFLSQWLGRKVPDPQPQDLDALDRYVEDLRATSVTLQDALEERQRDVQEATEHREQLKIDKNKLDAVVADLERTQSDQADRIRFLERRLREDGRGSEVYEDVAEQQRWGVPEDFTDLWSRIAEDSEHPIAEYVEFSNDDAGMLSQLERRDQHGRYLQKCWSQLRALHGYARLKAQGAFSGNVGHYLARDDHDGDKVPVSQHASGETEKTRSQFGDERIFPVPSSVDPSGRTQMQAHFRIGTSDTVAPRMYYFDDTDRSGKIYVGYIGPHLTNSKTRNA